MLMAGCRLLLTLVVESTLLALAGHMKPDPGGGGGRAPDAPARAASVCQVCTAAAECGGGASGGSPMPGGSPTPDPALCAGLALPDPLDLSTCHINLNPACHDGHQYRPFQSAGPGIKPIADAGLLHQCFAMHDIRQKAW